MIERTSLRVSLELDLKSKKAQAKIAEIEAVQVMIVDRVRTEVPSVCCPLPELESKDSFELGDFLMCDELGIVHAEVWIVVGMEMRGILLGAVTVLDASSGWVDAGVGYPVIVALIEVFEVDVVAVGILISSLGGVIIYN